MKTDHSHNTDTLSEIPTGDGSLDRRAALPIQKRFPRPPACEIISNLERLDAMAGEWRRLASESASPFHTFGWNRAWYRHFGGKKSRSMAVFVFRKNGVVVGILPCYRQGSELRLAGDDECDYQDILVEQDHLIPQMLMHLFSLLRKYHCDLHFACLSDKGRLHRYIDTTAVKLGYPHCSRQHCPCPWFGMKGSGDEFLRNQKPRVRKRIRAALRRTDKIAPAYQCRIHQGSEITPDLIDRLADLHIRNQYRKKGASVFSNPDFRRFLLEASLREDTGLRIASLQTAGGKLIAFDIGFERRKRFSVYIGSFEAEYSSCSPGTALLYHQIEEWTERGMEIYDFLCGNESYKYDYAEGEYHTGCHRVFRKSWFNRARVVGLEAEVRCRRIAKKILTRLGLIHFFIH